MKTEINCKIYAVILAGGKGSRLKKDLPKQFLPLGPEPVIMWSIKTFARINIIHKIIVVSPGDGLDRLNKLIGKPQKYKILKTITGGLTRQGSSYNAIHSFNFNDNDILLFHDAARPFVSEKVIIKCINGAKKNGAAGVYTPTVDTITEIHGEMVEGIIPRDRLYNTQTPQSFLYKIIKNSHEKALAQEKKNYTDDISIVLDAGYNVVKVDGDPSNYKITDLTDYELARWHVTNLSKDKI